MNIFEIPLRPVSQNFYITLALIQYKFTIIWRRGIWVLDIADRNAVPLISGVPLVPGIDLLAPYEFLDLGGRLVLLTAGEQDVYPTYAGLGTESRLYFATGVVEATE